MKLVSLYQDIDFCRMLADDTIILMIIYIGIAWVFIIPWETDIQKMLIKYLKAVNRVVNTIV
jgi:hypothetical protein